MGFRIKEARQEKGYTQEELANKSKVARTIIAGLESGAITSTSTKTLVKIARALGCPVTHIFFEDVV
ncbi:MAG: helix-turn-helix transcriptional regulator [Phascolarctobacterium sp.]